MGVEQRVETLDEVRSAAVVGVGPVGTQAVAVVVVPRGGSTRTPVAGLALTERVRAAAGTAVAAVLVRESLPVDIRHASKVDRAAVARWAADGVRGEVTTVVEGRADVIDVPTDAVSLAALVSDEEATGSTRKEAIVEVAKRAGLPKREVYDVVHR